MDKNSLLPGGGESGLSSVEQEHWVPVALPQFRDFYEVSDLGLIRKKNGVILHASSTGLHHHLQLKLRLPSGKTKNCMLAHLVMSAFGADPVGRPIGYHDKNPRHCAFSNLYFLSEANANGGGHTSQMLALKLEEVAARIWEMLLPLTTRLLAGISSK